MNIYLFVTLLLGLQILCFFIAKRCAKNVAGEEDYFLGGKRTALFPLLMTFLATQVGGGFVLGAAEEAYRFGWSVLFYPLGGALGLIFLGIGTGRKLASLQTSTVAQIFEKVYNSPNLKRLASILSIVSLFIVLVAQMIASRKFMVSVGVDNIWLFIAFWGLLIFYTSMGGFRAVVATDIIQALFFSGVFVVGLIAFFIWPTDLFIKAQQTSALLETTSYNQIYGWLLMPLLFMLIEQDMAQRCFAAPNSKVISQATIGSGILTFALCTIPVCMGVWARSAGIEIPLGSSVLMEASAAFASPALTAFIGAAVIAAILSTADSLINAIGSNLAQDFDYFSKRSKSSLNFLQISSLIIALVAIVCSFCFDTVLTLLISSYALSVSALFVPIFIALFRPKGNKMSAIASVCSGLGALFASWLLAPSLPAEMIGLVASALGFALAEGLLRLLSYGKKESEYAKIELCK